MKRKQGKRWLVWCVAACCVFASCRSMAGSVDRSIAVDGSGKAVVTPDIVTFSVRISETRPTTKEAQDAANRKMNQVIGVLEGAAVADRDISTDGLSLSPEYRWVDDHQELVGQNCSQNVSATLRDITALGSIIDQLGSVDGIQVGSIRFDKEDKTEAYEEARRNAAQEALDKATAYARQLGMQVGRARTVNDAAAYHEVLPRYKTMLAAEAVSASANQTVAPAGTLEVDASVSVVFDLY